MKKIAVLFFLCLIGMIGITMWDYTQNNRSVSAGLHTVSVTPYREQMTFSAPVIRHNDLHLMSGAVKKIEQAAIGDVAVVSLNGNTYKGYLWRLEPLSNGFHYATVSVVNLDSPLSGSATAVISGKTSRNIIFVPQECVVTDERGQDAVYVVQNGYAMLRNVQIGKLTEEGRKQIEEGVFASEKLIIAPQNIRTGDRVLPP